jgi:hypothetical protein
MSSPRAAITRVMRPLVYRTIDELLIEFRSTADDDLLKMIKVLDLSVVNELLQISKIE